MKATKEIRMWITRLHQHYGKRIPRICFDAPHIENMRNSNKRLTKRRPDWRDETG
jgi:hypothetical protein